MGIYKTKIKIILTLILSLTCLGIFTNSTRAADVTASASRTTGAAPLSVFFNADLTASSPTERSFHDYYYTWNFGDTNAGNWGTDGKPKNEDQGPVASHVYEAPGTYNVTLEVIDPADNSHVTALEETFEITVTDPDVVFAGTNTICVSDATNNDFVGCPSGAQNIATDSLASFSTWATSGYRVLLRRGSTWNINTALVGNAQITQARIGAYGTCSSPDANGICANAPYINSTGEDVVLFNLTYKHDFVIQDLSFSAIKDIDHGVVLGGAVDMSENLFLRNKVRGFDTAISISHSRTATYLDPSVSNAIVSCDIRDFYEYALYGGGENFSFMGNQAHNSDITHVTRVWWTYKGVYAHNMVSGSSLTNTAGRAALKFHGPKSTDSQEIDLFPAKIKQVGTFEETGASGLPYSTQYAVISDNIFGSSGPWPIDIRPQDTSSDERIYDVIYERNLMTQDFGDHSVTDWSDTLRLNGYYLTARNNVIDYTYTDGDLNGAWAIYLEAFDFMPPPVGVHLYNNTIYDKGDSFPNHITAIAIDPGYTDVRIYNNYMSFADAISTKIIINDPEGIADVGNNVMTNTPYFADPDNINPLLRDFSLTSNSTEAIDQGYTVPLYDDFLGNVRNGVFDIGAYEYQAQFRGDVDGDSTTNTTDALLTLRNSLGLSMTSTAWQVSATTGDVDCNGVSNSTDALLILRYSLGLNMEATTWCE